MLRRPAGLFANRGCDRHHRLRDSRPIHGCISPQGKPPPPHLLYTCPASQQCMMPEIPSQRDMTWLVHLAMLERHVCS